ncbi:MAG: tetratricopeptide repeat protein [Candidatus Methanomethylophilaceae archaeon]|nr:tetratricopeptide repeat protein [Candidatus Methanomethylophilaceae archaeon]
MTSDPAFEASSKAKRQAESGNPVGAAETLENYLSTDPHNIKLRLQLAQLHLYKLDSYDYGMMQLDIILDLDPDCVDALIAQVTVLSKYKKNNKESNEKFKRLLELAPSADMYNMYARFLRNQIIDFHGAAEYYEKAIAMDPGRYEFHQNYAVLLLNDLKDYEKARSELEIMLDMRPGDVMAKNNYDKLLRTKFDKNGNVKKKRLAFLRR